MLSRRRFIRQAALGAASISLLSPADLVGAAQQTDFLSFDLHSHPGAFFMKGHPGYPGDEAFAKTIAAMMEGKLTGAFFTLVADAPLIEITPTGVKPIGAYEPGKAAREYRRQFTVLREFLRHAHIHVAKKTSDLDHAFQHKKVAAFLACEGSEFLSDPSMLDHLHSDGIRAIQLVHYVPNALGDLQTSEAQHNGLSTAGKEVVKGMNKLKMVVDVAHASFNTVKDVVDITTAPIILSHSILKIDDNRLLAKRAITVEHAKLVAKTGGVVGAWPSGFNTTFDEFVDNTMRMIEAIGVDHVGLGTDMDGNLKPVFSSYTQLPAWAAALQAKGLSKEDTAKVMGGNVRRVLQQVIG